MANLSEKRTHGQQQNRGRNVLEAVLKHLLMVCLDFYWIDSVLSLRTHWTAMSLLFIPFLIILFGVILIYDHIIMSKYAQHKMLVSTELLLLIVATLSLRELFPYGAITLMLFGGL